MVHKLPSPWEYPRMGLTGVLREVWTSFLHWRWCWVTLLHRSPQSCANTVVHWFPPHPPPRPPQTLYLLRKLQCSHFILGSLRYLPTSWDQINYLSLVFGSLTESFAVLCSSFLSTIQNQTRFIIPWLITNHCGDAAAQINDDVNFNDQVILISRTPATRTQSYRRQKEFFLNFLKTYSCV